MVLIMIITKKNKIKFFSCLNLNLHIYIMLKPFKYISKLLFKIGLTKIPISRAIINIFRF